MLGVIMGDDVLAVDGCMCTSAEYVVWFFFLLLRIGWGLGEGKSFQTE